MTKVEYIPNKIKYQFELGISTKEENEVQYKGNKENKYCIQVIKKIINMAT